MPFTKDQLAMWQELRNREKDDTKVINNLMQRFPDSGGYWNELRKREGNDTKILDKLLNMNKDWRVSGTAWDAISRSSQNQYQKNYNIVITGRKSTQPKPYEAGAVRGTAGDALSQQAEPEAVEQETELPSYMGTEQYQYPSAGVFGKVLKEDYGKYNKNIRQPILGKFREEKVKGQQQVGKLPTALQIEGLVFNRQSVGVPKEQMYQYPIEFGDKQQNRLTLVELAKNRMIPTYDQMKKELGDQRAKSLMNEIQKQYPSGLLTKETTAKQQGKVIGLSKNPVIDAFASTAVQVFEEELSDPNEWIFELLPLGAIMSLGKRTATGSVKVGRGMIKNIPDALKKDIGGVRKRIIDEIFANYPRKQATQLVNDVAKITDNEIAETLANSLLDKVDLDEIIAETTKRQATAQATPEPIGKGGQAVPGELIPAKQPSIDDIIGATERQQGFQDVRRAVSQQPQANAQMGIKEYVDAKGRGGYTQDTAIGLYRMDVEDAITKGEPINADALSLPDMKIPEGYTEQGDMLVPLGTAESVAPGLPVTSAESIEDIIANSPSGKILDTPKLQSLAQEGDVLKFGDDSISQIIGMGDDGEWKLRELEAPSLPVEPTKAELPTNIPEAETIAPEGQVAMPYSIKSATFTKDFSGTKEFETLKHDIEAVGEMPDGSKVAYYRMSGLRPITDDLYNDMMKKDVSDNTWIYEKGKLKHKEIATPETPTGVVAEGQIAGEVDTPKQAWEMTRDEFANNVLANDKEYQKALGGKNKVSIAQAKNEALYQADAVHRSSIIMSLSEGKPVPAEVLADYPDLAKVTDQATPKVTNQPTPEKKAWQMSASEYQAMRKQNVDAMKPKKKTQDIEDMEGISNQSNYLRVKDAYANWKTDHQKEIAYALDYDEPVQPKIAGEYPSLLKAYGWKYDVGDYVEAKGFSRDDIPLNFNELSEKQLSELPIGKVVLEHKKIVDKAVADGDPIKPNITEYYYPTQTQANQAKVGDDITIRVGGGREEKATVNKIWDNGKLNVSPVNIGGTIDIEPNQVVNILATYEKKMGQKTDYGQWTGNMADIETVILSEKKIKPNDVMSKLGMPKTNENAGIVMEVAQNLKDDGKLDINIYGNTIEFAPTTPDVSEVTQVITREQVKGFYTMKDYTLGGYDAVNGEGSAQRAINDGLLEFEGDTLKLTESAKDDIFGVVPHGFKVKVRNGEPQIDTFFESAEVPPYAKRVKQSIHDGRPIVHAEIPYTNWKEFTETYPLYKGFDDMKAKAVVDVAQVEQAIPETTDVVKVSDDYYRYKFDSKSYDKVKGINVENPYGVEIFGVKEKNGYNFYEGITGMQITAGTRYKSIQEFKNQMPILYKDVDFNTPIQSAIKNNQISPRYKAPEAPAKAYVPDDSAVTKEPRAKAVAETKAKRQAKKNIPAGQSISTQGLLNRIKPEQAKGLNETMPTTPKSRLDMSVVRKASERARKAKDFITNKYKLKEIVTATNYAELRSPKTRVKYGTDMNKLGDELNTFNNVALRRSVERAGDEIVLTYGDLNDDQLASFWHVMQDKTHIGNYEKYGTTPKDIEITAVINQLNTETQLLSQTPEGRQVLDGVARYEALIDEIKTDLIMRGKLNPDNVSDAFYFHRVDFNHVQNNVFKQKSAHDPMRGYAFKAFGGEEDIVVDQAVLNQYLTQVHYDNAIDDFVKEWLEKSDRGNLLAQLTDKKLAQFKNDYLPYQYKRGNVVYSDEIVSFKELDEEINAFLDNYPDFTPQDVQAFLESITSTDPDKTMAKMAHIIGQRQKEYWIPKPMAEAFNNMTDQTPKFMRQMERLTRWWKSITLGYSSVSGGYQPQNLFGDWLNVAVRDNPESLKYAPVVSKIWRWTEDMMGRQPSISPRTIRKASEGLTVTLTPDEMDMMNDVFKYNVLGGTGITDISEYGMGDLRRGTKQLKDWWVKLNYMRESQPRIAMFAYQRDMVKKTGWVDTITFRNDVIGMEPVQAAAYVAKNSPVDYIDVPSWYRHNMNGFWLPFVTYHHKNAVNWVKYTNNSVASLFNGKIPQEVLDANPNILQTAKTARGVPNAIKALSVPLIAYGSAYYWNTRTNEARRYAYKHLPETIQQRPNAIVLKTFNDMSDMGNPDSQPNRAWVIAPNMPDQLAMQFLGIDKFFTYLKSVDLKVMTPKEAAEAYLKDLQSLDVGVLKMSKRMLNPLMKCLVSLAQNKDMITGQAIYPDEVKDVPYIRRDYEAGYVMRTLLSAVSAYAYEQYDGEQLRASELVTGIPRSMGNTAKTLLGVVTPEYDEEAVERTGGWERWFAENKTLMGALGIYEVDLLKEKTKRIEREASKVQRERNRVAYEITDLYVDALINKDSSKLQEYITNGVASGELAPATLTINGVQFRPESPEMYWAELNKDIEQKLNNSTTVRKLINGLQREAKTTGDMDKKLKLQNAYTLYRYDKVLRRLSNMATDEQVKTMDVIMDEFNFESEF